MEAMLSVIAVLTFTAVTALWRTKRRGGSWGQAAQRYGLDVHTAGKKLSLEGSVDGVEVRVRGEYGGQYTLTLRGRQKRLPTGVRMSRQWGFNAPGSAELQLGEGGFDRKVYLEGPDDVVAAMLNGRARGLMRGLLDEHSIVVESGQLEVSGGDGAVHPDLETPIEQSLALFHELCLQDESVAERLLHNALHDRVPAVRRTNLLLLLREHGDSETGQRGVAAAAQYDDPEIRLLRASRLKDGAAEALGALLRDEALSNADRLRTLKLGRPWGAAFEAELRRALQRCDGEVLSAVAEHVGEKRLRDLLPQLHDRAPQVTGVAASGFCRAFKALDDEHAEPHLVRFLSDRDSEVQQEAAIALAALGTVNAVQPLLELTRGVFRSPQVKSAARRAVGEIQWRLRRADVGDLALVEADDPGGDLSLADEAGDLSLHDSKR